ncbi:hydrogenase expression/formation protein HypE [Paracraurococcus lichenis]|uniref:Hydrogenase expression/formation protein HypE n=1 Tax=Paracraurococcus lichenis TaxID=3064888 RepID=A0ABT9DZI3_9PROT|nr:hydrogenase expression/formation protein HypE [Paracraurococcus sp. LOR1-02]MDO9709318.1 hydrogenase expression/formation protein HypE [Paracraurococcus sp. LOR1-02]
MSAVRRRRLDLAQGRVELAHGGGGRAMGQLVEEVFRAAFDNPVLARAEDASPIGGGLVMTTDSFVVSPLFFPGGDIGSLAVHGTVNDLAMAGAAPVALSAAFVIEEGFPLADLARIAASMAAAAREAGVPVVTGDTKVVERGKGDGVFVTTTGIGRCRPGIAPSAGQVRPGDVILLNGPVGDHGVAIMAAREGMEFAEPLLSDSAALHGLVGALLAAAPGVRCLRDPTRGGLAATLNEVADRCGCGMLLQEAAIPVRPAVAAACELLGLDPLHVANEGKLVAILPPGEAEAALAALRAHPLGREAARIGTVTEDARRYVQIDTRFGGRRMVDWLAGEQLPRIC